MKTFSLFTFLFIFSFSAEAQEVFKMKLTPEVIQIFERSFYIEEVVDLRTRQNSGIGIIIDPESSSQVLVDFRRGLKEEIETYFQVGLPQHPELVPVQILVNRIWLYDNNNMDRRNGEVQLDVMFQHNNQILLRDTQSVHFSGTSIYHLFEPGIKTALKNSLIILAESGSLDSFIANSPDLVKVNPSSELVDLTDYERIARKKKFATNIGIGIGGHNLGGVEVETLLGGNIGGWAGIGYVGAGLGVRIHTQSQNIRTPYLNLGLRANAGVGVTSGLQIGSYLMLSESFGLIAEAGFGIVLDDNPRNGTKVLLIFGVGFSF